MRYPTFGTSPLILSKYNIPGMLLVLLLFFVASSPGLAQTCTGIPDAECQTLYALYNGTGGDQWTDNTNWLSTQPADDWYGVTIESGHVTVVELFKNGLTGPLPSEVENLNSLEWLHLNLNNPIDD